MSVAKNVTISFDDYNNLVAALNTAMGHLGKIEKTYFTNVTRNELEIALNILEEESES